MIVPVPTPLISSTTSNANSGAQHLLQYHSDLTPERHTSKVCDSSEKQLTSQYTTIVTTSTV